MEKVCDIKIDAGCYAKSCVICAGDSSTVIAKMQKKQTAQSFFFGKDNFMVTVSPNVDYAFIVALIVILDENSKPASSHLG
ncbi:Protein LURP-one-related 15 [Morella rubra]|uniref:Protein LURP-one-related 15 n=1 Tax=Morella rubra TaxID=262757 RepID=A0A6A1V827_9ROSI|nr:Protein LURP-one-related 15 [Morella rubra]